MDKGLLVEIFVPLSNGQDGNIGTGYPVANDLVLTARHVLFPEKRDQSKPIELRWHFKGTPWVSILEDDIVWHGGQNLDAALVRFSLPEETCRFGFLSINIPKPNDSWSSDGFAEVGKRANNKRLAVGLIGKIISANGDNHSCEIGVDYRAQGEGAQQWQGVSGCPIFDGRLIVGIAKSCPTKFAGNRLSVTLSRALLNNPEFREKIGFERQNDRLKKAIRRITRILEKSESAAIFLRDGLQDTHPPISSGNEALSERLLKTDFYDVLNLIEEARFELGEDEDTPAVEALKNLSHLLIPLVFDSGMIDSMRQLRNETSIALIDMPITTSTLAELIMAGVDGRLIRFKVLSKGDKFPKGENCLEKLPEAGIDNHENSFIDRFHNIIIDEFLGADEKTRKPDFTRDEKIKRAARYLDILADKPDSQTRYVIYQNVDNQLRRQIEQLKSHYPALVFLSLDTDNDKSEKELKPAIQLRSIFLDHSFEAP